MARRTTIVCLILVLLALTMGVVYAVRTREGQNPPRPQAVPPDRLTILYTCDTRGHINPCNCTAGVAGGLARRKVFIEEQEAPAALLVDAGNVTAGGRAWELLEFEYLLRGYELMGYDAVNIGRREAGIAAESLREIRRQFPFLISANVQSTHGELLFDPWVIVATTGGYQVGIIGILDDTLPPDELGAGVRVAPPGETLSRMLPDLRKRVDFVVLLAFANEETMKALAERYYEIDVIIGGDVAQPATEPLQLNKSFITYVTDKGKSIGRLDLAFIDGEKVVESNDITMLLEDTSDESMAALVAELRRRQIENNYPTEKEDEEGLTRISGGA